MSWKVEYTGKDGKRTCSPAFGSPGLADTYAKTVKAPKVIPVDVDAPQVQVQKVPDAAVVDQERVRQLEAAHREHQAEAYLETGSQARLAGLSTSEALDLANQARNRIGSVEIVTMCANCNRRRARPGFTVCYTCQRRL